MSTNLNSMKSILFTKSTIQDAGSNKNDSKETKDRNEPKSDLLKVCGVIIHNDGGEHTIENADITITDGDNKSLFSGKMSELKKTGFVPNFKVQFNTTILCSSKDSIDEHMQACIKKGLIETASFPIKLSVKACTYDPWSDNMRYTTINEILTIEKLSLNNIEDGYIQVSFKNFTLKESETSRNKFGI